MSAYVTRKGQLVILTRLWFCKLLRTPVSQQLMLSYWLPIPEGRLFPSLINTPVIRFSEEEELLKKQTLKFGVEYGRSQQKQMIHTLREPTQQLGSVRRGQASRKGVRLCPSQVFNTRCLQGGTEKKLPT